MKLFPSFSYLQETNNGMMCVHILIWCWWLMLIHQNVLICEHITRQKFYDIEHTHCYDMIAHHVTIWGFLNCFVTCLSITNIGMMCVHILVWHWWLIMNVMKCGHIPKQKCYYVCTHIVMIFLIIVLQFEFKKSMYLVELIIKVWYVYT